MVLNSSKIYLDSCTMYNLSEFKKKRMIKFGNSDIDLFKFSRFFAEFKLINLEN